MTTLTATAVSADQLRLAAEYMSGTNGADTVDVSWQSVKSAKQIRAAHRSKIIASHTTATVDRGIKYTDHPAHDGSASGALPYGEWLIEDHLILHKGQILVRLYAQSGTMVTTYTADGKPITREEFQAMTYKSSGGSNPTGCVNVKIQNLTVA